MVILTRPQLAIGSTIILGTLFSTRQFWWRSQAPVLYPPQDVTKQGNRFFLPVRNESELSDLLLIKRPLLMNFTVRGDPYCNKVTGALQRIITFEMEETKKKINVVDVEVDDPGTKELLLRFGVKNIPTVVCARKTLPVDWYVDEKLLKDPKAEVDWEKLKAFIEKNADDE
ncbi:hypothetical protein WICPIJ_004228 [Wickerhamomyces pijperi]|uniref:Thioredoxin domain-containing protein n=1 Tax=Wickerhamomyces pijperi TaxID=599730 RepID=A0A9P8TN44_WICPI|nr:hypothetical protein WICPIJ_004228 [Wickerhamomyces pijperi]